ncbi:Homeobox-leucine zipper protein HAT14 [Sesamum alatum]|uniref:Homeobox-leucine zipper protein HAT14 n=1 Tax=Sesamum alatum TaxID=300844 RepID=A0AAE2CRV1_9LAMI|nr:Homeobox-leucine zipper protein HAT14 [Sesamum alatum]
MELGLSLGDHHDSDDTPKPFSFLDKSETSKILGKDLGFCMSVGKVSCADGAGNINGRCKETEDQNSRSSTSPSDPPRVQLDLLPLSPLHTTQPSSNKFPFSWLTQNSCMVFDEPGRGRPEETEERAAAGEVSCDPKSRVCSSVEMDFSVLIRPISGRGKRDLEGIRALNIINQSDIRGSCSRGSDDHEEENGMAARKKLRLSKQQSAFLEENFKEHHTLNTKQKLGLAKQLNLRPRQVEVWFQNRRARTKLKQTEVDCEYLKRWCEKLRQENTRLQKEVQELRALNKATSSTPFYMPTTTLLTMCSSCQRLLNPTTI